MYFPLLIATVASLAATGAALPAAESPAIRRSAGKKCSAAAVDKLIFDASMSTFQSAREKNKPDCHWSSDMCSWWSGKPQVYGFRPVCQRHDFGYRNTKEQKRLTKAMKESLDAKFIYDVYVHCAQFYLPGTSASTACMLLGAQYYHFAQDFGNNSTNSEGKNERMACVLDIELDDDIVGQDIPHARLWGEDVSDLDAWLDSAEE